jgi:uncharacterized protein (TIGR02996 family)
VSVPCAPCWWDDGDDAARLVHADALTSAGDPRGEFIFLQCTAPTSPRLDELWRAHHLDWLLELELPRYTWSPKKAGLSTALFGAKSGLELWTAQFERGFLTRLWAPRLASHQVEAMQSRATLRHLELEESDLSAVVASASAFRLEGLGVLGATSVEPAKLEALVRARVFLELAELSFNAGTEDADARAAWMVRAVEHAPRLTRLSLSGVLSVKPLRVIRQLDWARRLTHLEVATRDATEELVPLLEQLPALQSLTLNVHHARPELAQALLAHPALRQARIRTSAPTLLPEELGWQLRERLGPEALVRF